MQFIDIRSKKMKLRTISVAKYAKILNRRKDLIIKSATMARLVWIFRSCFSQKLSLSFQLIFPNAASEESFHISDFTILHYKIRCKFAATLV